MNPKKNESRPASSIESLAAERAELDKQRAEIAAERQLLDEELAALSAPSATKSKTPPGRIHQRDLPPDVADLPAWLAQQGKKGIVRDYEVVLRGGKRRPITIGPIIAGDESEAISLAFAQRQIENTQAYNASVRRLEA
ncbi:MAG: hypothetical protein ACIALR_11480 [Blastopirellula sp. JB062]